LAGAGSDPAVNVKTPHRERLIRTAGTEYIHPGS
jgi:hypothetical protein